jgi:hypothetical protein
LKKLEFLGKISCGGLDVSDGSTGSSFDIHRDSSSP